MAKGAPAQTGLADGPVPLKPMPKLGHEADAFPRFAAANARASVRQLGRA
jgi:hypothetical protein